MLYLPMFYDLRHPFVCIVTSKKHWVTSLVNITLENKCAIKGTIPTKDYWHKMNQKGVTVNGEVYCEDVINISRRIDVCLNKYNHKRKIHFRSNSKNVR